MQLAAPRVDEGQRAAADVGRGDIERRQQRLNAPLAAHQRLERRRELLGKVLTLHERSGGALAERLQEL